MTISYTGRTNSSNGGSGSGTDISTTLPSNTAGNLIVVGVGWVDGGAITAAVSDSQGNTYTACRAKTRNATNGYSIQEFYAWGIAGSTSTNTITADYSTLTTFADIHVAEYTSSNGAWTADPLDKTNAATGNSTALNSGTVTPTQSGELLVTVGFCNDGTISAGTGFTLRSTGANGVGLADLVQTTATAKAGLLATSVSSQWGIQVASFRDATASAQTVDPAGIATAQTFGTPTVAATATMSPAGIATGEAFGTPAVIAGAATVSPTGIGSAETFGTAAVVPGSATLAPTGIPTAQAVGAPAVSTAATISPDGIPTAFATGTPTLLPAAVTVSPPSIPSVEALGTPTLAPGPVTVSPDGIASGAAFGTATLTTSATLSPTGIPSAATLGEPAITGGTVTVMPHGIHTRQTFGQPTVTAGAATISPTGIASSAAFGNPAVSATTRVTPPGIPSDAAIGTPALTATAVISPPGIPTAEAVPAPAIALKVSPTGIPSTTVLGTPTVSPGTATVAPPGIPTRQTFGDPTVTVINPGEFAAGQPMSPWIVGEPVANTWTCSPPASPWIAGWPDVDNISTLSTQYVQVPVTELVSGLPADPTALPVYGAFLLGRAEPGDSDWLAGSWDAQPINGQYFAQVLIGPDGLKTLTPGQWVMWLKVEADQETPIMQAGTITVY